MTRNIKHLLLIARAWRRTTRVIAVLVVALWIGISSALATPVPDPVGDTFGAGAVKPDITSINATPSGATVIFSVTYAGAISPASAFAANSIVGFIDIDADLYDRAFFSHYR